MSQKDKILNKLKECGRVTLREAFDEGYGYKLVQRIHDLRKEGWQIERYSHDTSKGETASDNAYILKFKEKIKIDDVGQVLFI